MRDVTPDDNSGQGEPDRAVEAPEWESTRMEEEGLEGDVFPLQMTYLGKLDPCTRKTMTRAEWRESNRRATMDTHKSEYQKMARLQEEDEEIQK